MQLGFRELAPSHPRSSWHSLGRDVANHSISYQSSVIARRGLAPSLIFNVVVITYAMMQPEKRVLWSM